MSKAAQAALRARTRQPTGERPESFGGIEKTSVRSADEKLDFRAIQHTPRFLELRRRVKWFVFPMTLLFLAWYLTYVVLADYAHAFMATPVIGEINIGLLMGLGQFVSTVAITALYVRFANRTIDPAVDEIRRDAEGSRTPEESRPPEGIES